MTGFKHIGEFLDSEEFRNAIIVACKNFEVLSEADLQVFVCRRLFELFAVTPNLRSKYRVNAEPFCRELNFYPDIAIFHRRSRVPDQPAIAIELKEGHTFGTAVEHDCEKLRGYCDSIPVRRAHLIHVVHTGTVKEFWRKFETQKNGFKNIVGIPVVLQETWSDSKYKQWHERRRTLVEALKAPPAKNTKIQAATASS